MQVIKPYFMTNEEWYYHDEKEFKYKLTEKGEKVLEVVESYNKFYKELEENN